MTNAESILSEAKKYADSMSMQRFRCTYLDYERFKRKLHDNNIFGYERELSDILKV